MKTDMPMSFRTDGIGTYIQSVSRHGVLATDMLGQIRHWWMPNPAIIYVLHYGSYIYKQAKDNMMTSMFL